MSELDRLGQVVERITGDPLGNSIHGAVRVEVVSPPAGRRRYQLCRLTVVPIAAGTEYAPVPLEVVVDTRFWPAVGTLLPARIAVTDPSVLDVTWDALRR